jgi:hypothetical protein
LGIRDCEEELDISSLLGIFSQKEGEIQNGLSKGARGVLGGGLGQVIEIGR